MVLLCGSSVLNTFVTESKLTLFAAQQANKSGDKLLRQGRVALFGKPDVREDGGLVS